MTVTVAVNLGVVAGLVLLALGVANLAVGSKMRHAGVSEGLHSAVAGIGCVLVVAGWVTAMGSLGAFDG